MMTHNDFDIAIELINKSASILATTHTRPDGDACGCVAAMCEGLRALGKKVKPLMLSPVPAWYGFLFTEKVPVLGEDVQAAELTAGGLGEFDLIVIVDTNSMSQLPKFDEYLKGNDKPVLVVDHHTTGDSLGDAELLDSTAGAAGLIVLELFKHAGWPVTERVAEALFVA
ncbi:MAG: DHH family phosphoesterase, partial [Sedimentisphaerales bacterium]